METFFALLTLCVGNSPVTGEFPPQRPVRGAWINGSVNNRNTGDFRRHSTHDDVIVMYNIYRDIFQRGGDHDTHPAVDHVQAKKDAEVCSLWG